MIFLDEFVTELQVQAVLQPRSDLLQHYKSGYPCFAYWS